MKIIFIIPIVVILIAAGAGGAWYMKVGPFASAAAGGPPPETGVVHYLMPERIVNLSDRPGYRYLKIRISLEFVDPAHKPGELKGDAMRAQESLLIDELDRFSAGMDDFLTTTLAAKTSTDLLTAEGKDQLRDQIMKGFKSRIADPTLRAVYFTEFVIQ